MNTLLAFIVIGLYLAKAALVVAVIVVCAMIWAYAKEEIDERLTFSRAEKKRIKEQDDDLFTKWCREKKTWTTESIRSPGHELSLRRGPRHAAA